MQGTDVRDWLKQKLGPRWRGRIRRAGRLRWITKVRILRHHGVSLRERPLQSIRYVLLDPEVESYTYDITNEDELVAFAQRALDVEPENAWGWIAETRADPEFNERFARHVPLHFLSTKRRLALGNRLAWYVFVRALKPGLVVETGILNGMGSLVLLRALERNAQEGSPGTLISFDIVEDSGWLVPPRLREGWERRIEPIEEGLELALDGREVDLFFHDSVHEPDHQRLEFGIALRHAAPSLVIVDNSGLQLDVLRELAEEHGTERLHFRERPVDHFWPASGAGVAVFRR